MGTPGTDDVDEGEYCRSIETYLCRKNDGHLIRLAGPSFSRVVGWARQGIPLNAVYRGIDRYFERYHSKGPRRRPVQIDFCEADVLDVFDEWRRAVGTFTTRTLPENPAEEKVRARRSPAWPADGDAAPQSGPPPSLAAHLDRLITRLTTMRGGGRLPAQAHAAIDATVRDIDLLKARVVDARGEQREHIVARLVALDGALHAALLASLPATEASAIEDEARAELARFKAGMSDDAYERAVAASVGNLLRARLGLPDIRYEGPPS